MTVSSFACLFSLSFATFLLLCYFYFAYSSFNEARIVYFKYYFFADYYTPGIVLSP